MSNLKCTNKVVGFLLYLNLDVPLSPMKSSFQLELIDFSYRPWSLTHLSTYICHFAQLICTWVYNTYIVKPFHTYCDSILNIFTIS